MWDVARIDTSLEAKQSDLEAKVREGRATLALLNERQAAVGRKIEEASAGLHRLEKQLAAVNAVIQLYEGEGLMLAADPPGRRPSIPAIQAARAAPPVQRLSKPKPFRPFAYLRCLIDGHDMVANRTTAGLVTCRRCGLRRRA